MKEKVTFTIENPMPPLWLMFPEISKYSIGWRMGYGEEYRFDFIKWIETLSTEELNDYKTLFPIPKRWTGFWSNNSDEWENTLYRKNKYRTILWQQNGTPEYALPQLLKDYDNGKEIKLITFWGHKPASNGKITKACFSQWWLSDFVVDGIHYCCMEQYMMAEKARLFGDEEILKEILNNNSQQEIKALGKNVKYFENPTWDQIKYSIVLNGNFHKFIQNKGLKEYLLSTGNDIIVEASPYDDIWGIKMPADDERISNPNRWQGKNLLGFALMEVRNELMRICQNEAIIDWESINRIYNND